jgi:hypothetical protein
MRIRKFTSDLISMGRDQAQQHPQSPKLPDARISVHIYIKRERERERFSESFRERKS